MAMRDIDRLRKEAAKLSSKEQVQLAELLIEDARKKAEVTDINVFAGKVTLTVDPLEYQRSLRAEWP
jgi:hypothetical protein